MENEIETGAPPPVSSLRSRWEAMAKRADGSDDTKPSKTGLLGSIASRSHRPEDRPTTPTVVVSSVSPSNAPNVPLRRVVSTPTSQPGTPSPSETSFSAPRSTRTSFSNSRDASRADGSSTEEEDNNLTPSPATPRKTPSTPSFNIGSSDYKGLGIGLGSTSGCFATGKRSFSGSSAGRSDGATSPRNSIVAQLVEKGFTDAEDLSKKLSRKPPPPPPGKKPPPPAPPTRNEESNGSHPPSRSATPSADSDDSRQGPPSTPRNHLRAASSASNLSINLAPPGPPRLPARGTPSPTLPPRSPAPMKSPALPPRSTDGPAAPNIITYHQNRGFHTPSTEHLSPAGSDGSEGSKPSLVPPKLPSRGGNGPTQASPATMNGPPLPRRTPQVAGGTLDQSSPAPRLPPRASPRSAPSSPDETTENSLLESTAGGRRVPLPPLDARDSLTPTGDAPSHPPPPQRTPSGDAFLPPPSRVVPSSHDVPIGSHSLKEHHHRHHYPHLPHQLNTLPITKILAAVKLGGNHSSGSRSPRGPGSPGSEYPPSTSNVELTGTAGLPPPPVRNLVDKVASMRPHSSAGRSKEEDATSSDDEEGDNSAPTTGGSGIKRPIAKVVDELPDSSRSNRRPPILPEFQHPPSVYAAHHRVTNLGDGARGTEIRVPAHSGVVAVAGWWVVVAGAGIITVTNMNTAQREKATGGSDDGEDDWESEREQEATRGAKGVWTIEMKEMNIEWKVDKPRVTAMEFRHGSPKSGNLSSRNPSSSSLNSFRTAVNRPSTAQSDHDRYLWCGTRDGCLFELDVWNGGRLTDVRIGAHAGHVTGIFRLPGQRMLTIDEHGKCLVFCGVGIGKGNEDGSHHTKSGDGFVGWLGRANPRIHRIQHRDGFARVLNGRLWTSPAPGGSNGSHSNAAGSSENMLGSGGSLASIAQAAANSHRHREHHHHHHRNTSQAAVGPTVRIHEVDDDGALVTRNAAPGHNIGAVLCGTVLPSTPGLVYLGHEGGWVTVWKGEDDAGEKESNGSLRPPLQHHESLSSLTSTSTSSCSDGDEAPRMGDHSSRGSIRADKGRGITPVPDVKGPICVRKVKISISDVISLEGVASRLWAGTRKGHIYAYDVTGSVEAVTAQPEAAKDKGAIEMEQRLWTVTNVWRAHGELPVARIIVDPYSISLTDKLVVYSVGRDEVLRFWDGFLSQNWIDSEMISREALFCTFRPLKMLICTWNIDAAKPDALVGTNNVTFLKTFLLNPALEGSLPDVIVFGFQEVIDLEDKKLTAKTVLLGAGKKRADGTISEKVSRHYRMWHDRLVSEVQRAYPAESYIVQHTENLVGLFTCVFVRRTLAHPASPTAAIRDVSITTIKRGMLGTYGNKGAIVARFIVDDSSFCLLNCHLAAGQSQKVARNMDLASILEEKAVFPVSSTENGSSSGDFVAYIGGGDGSMILDHELCFLNGDLNYRIEQRRDAVISNVQAGKFAHLLQYDQLLHEIRSNPTFRLQAFTEAPITFAPTYKYDRRSNTYDTSEKKRIPAWCDRILYRSRDASRIQNLWYGRYEPDVSDHRPVCGAYHVIVKKVIPEKRAKELNVVRKLWDKEQLRLGWEVRTFYEGQ